MCILGTQSLWSSPAKPLFLTPGVIRVAFLLLLWYLVPRPMVPRQNLGPHVCCSHTLVSLGARWYLGMCDYDSTAHSLHATLITTLVTCYSTTLKRVVSYVHCIMTSKTRIHSINEQ